RHLLQLAGRLKLVYEEVLGAGRQGQHDGDAGRTDDHREYRQRGTQFLASDVLEREADVVKELHVSMAVSPTPLTNPWVCRTTPSWIDSTVLACRATFMSWVTTIRVIPCVEFSSRNRPMISMPRAESRLPVG